MEVTGGLITLEGQTETLSGTSDGIVKGHSTVSAALRIPGEQASLETTALKAETATL